MARSLFNRYFAGIGVALFLAACGSISSPAPPLAAQHHAASRDHRTGLGRKLTSGDGGQIFGFAVSQDNADGILSSASHVQTFDQTTGAIIGSFPEKTPSGTSYSFDGIFAGDVALVTRYVVPPGSIYAKRRYDTISPFTAGRFTGSWTPPDFDIDVQQVSQNPASTTSALFAIKLKSSDRPTLFVSDIGANTFSKVINLDPVTFALGDAPQLGAFLVDGKAVFATSPDGGRVGGLAPINVLVDLTTGAKQQFNGFNGGPFGAGYVNGMAVDPNTGIEATTTELNAQVEFYDVRKQTGVADVQLPCTGGGDQGNSGAGVTVDTVHKLFLVTDPSYACVGGSAIVVYDETGNEVEAITGFTFFIAEPPPAINMGTRTGWVYGPHLNQLQQFFY